MATAKENMKRMNEIKNNGINWDKDKDFIKTLRHAKRSDKYWEKISREKSGEVISYIDTRYKRS